MEFTVIQNERGIRNLYFGHPFAKETYTNSFQLKAASSLWAFDVDAFYSGDKTELVPGEPVPNDVETELRIVRGTKCIFIGDFEKVQEMQQEPMLYRDLCNRATVKRANPDYLDFDVYTNRILNDPLQSLDTVKSIDPVQAKKYMEYAVKYDQDKQYSDKLIIKPYFVTVEEGTLVLFEDFVDVNFELQVSPEMGVCGATVWVSENSSHYLDYYKEI